MHKLRKRPPKNIKNFSLSSEKKREKRQLEYLSSLKNKQVSIDSINFESIPELGGLKTRKRDLLWTAAKRSKICRRNPLSTEGTVSSKELQTAQMQRHYHMFSEMLETVLIEIDFKINCSVITEGLQNDSSPSFFAIANENRLFF